MSWRHTRTSGELALPRSVPAVRGEGAGQVGPAGPGPSPAPHRGAGRGPPAAGRDAPDSADNRGADDLWRIRIGDYRVVYEIHDDELIVQVIRVAHRGVVYRDS
ncbi:MAG: type II toxin-antitoxin system RelE/ParE family toxin [Pseudonocardiaceae bacterium]